MNDLPRTLKHPAVLEERRGRIHDSHVAPLNDWVEGLRRRLGPDAFIPWFDPADGGVHAAILWLLEAPGRRATETHGGSGFISSDNNDATAENMWRTREEAGVSRSRVVHWNVIPYYIGTDSKIRSPNASDLADTGPLLGEVLDLLPSLSCVVLAGQAAQQTWRRFRPPGAAPLRAIECPHPSPRNLNSRPSARLAIVEAWRKGADATWGQHRNLV